ncbi:hypothetical protein BaRGS_00005253 [Batillaria attramentaria]|uniref:Uncharacterized protein n=1 Tax=Batillaria attramentaria TaxID=370345 RepID=A0ABD0LVE1_9CAEN
MMAKVPAKAKGLSDGRTLPRSKALCTAVRVEPDGKGTKSAVLTACIILPPAADSPSAGQLFNFPSSICLETSDWPITTGCRIRMRTPRHGSVFGETGGCLVRHEYFLCQCYRHSCWKRRPLQKNPELWRGSHTDSEVKDKKTAHANAMLVV